jgi:hypothetical protein
LDLEDSKFSELPAFFEVSHLALDLTIDDPALIPVASSLTNQLKSDLYLEQGVELDVVVRAKTFVGQ